MKLPSFFTSLLSTYFRWSVGGVVVLVLVLGYLFVLKGQLSSLQTTSLAERTRTQTELKNQQVYLTALRGSIEQFQRQLPSATLASIDDFLPSNPDFPGLLLTIRNIAAAANVNLQSLALSDSGQLAAASTTTGSGAGGSAANAAVSTSLSLRTQDAAISIAGGTSYDDFKSFLSAVERSRRLLDVIALSFGVSSGPTGGNQSYSLTVRTYYLPNPK